MDAASGVFASDECFHVTAATTILRMHALPAEFPQFYSGFFYYYPPLFHVLGALCLAWFGFGGLHLLPTVIYGATLATLALAGRKVAPAGAVAAAGLLFASHPIFLLYGTKLYAEGLSALLAVAATVAVVEWWRTPSRGRALLAGLLCGLGVLTKLTVLTPLVLLLGVAVAAARPGSSRPARQLAWGVVLALGLALAVPIHNQIFYRSALYPIGAWDLDRALYALNHARFSSPVGVFYLALPRAIGPWLGLAMIAAVAMLAWRRSAGIWEAAFGLAIASMLLAPLVPFVQSRHLLPFLAVAALASMAMIFERLRWNPTLRDLALLVFLVPAAIAHADFRSPRATTDLPEHLKQAFRQFKPLLHENDLVLSLWTYDTAYYTGARATWPNPWGQRPERRPIAMFAETDARRFVAELRERGIGFVLMPSEIADQPFNSANYPMSFVHCVNEAVSAGAMGPVWTTGKILLIKVPAS
jgi:hypothetical protein